MWWVAYFCIPRFLGEAYTLLTLSMAFYELTHLLKRSSLANTIAQRNAYKPGIWAGKGYAAKYYCRSACTPEPQIILRHKTASRTD